MTSNLFHGQNDTQGGSGVFGSTLNSGGGPINFNSGSAPSDNHAQAVLRALKLTDPRSDLTEILLRKDELLADTCHWVCEDEAFKIWIESKNGQWPIMWLHGDAGKGKTMMMVALADAIKLQLQPNETMVYYFCQSSSNLSNTAVAILRGLLYFLADGHHQIVSEIQRAYRQNGNDLFEGPAALTLLWTLLMRTVNLCEGTVYFLVDALDECSHQIDLLLRTDTGQRTGIKWLLSSRNDHQVRTHLEDTIRIQHTSLEVNAERVSAAVEKYIDIKIKGLETRLAPDTLKVVRQHLVDNADGTFLWVSLVCKMLSSPRAKPWRAHEMVRKTPAGLEPLYDRILRNITENSDEIDGDHCKAVLRAVYLAARPLLVEEICLVAGLDSKIFGNTHHMNAIIDDCGSFLIVKTGIVSFVHKSAADYFQDGPGRLIFPHGFAFHQAQVFSFCLRRMNQDLHYNMAKLTHPKSNPSRPESSANSPQLKYACMQWHAHLDLYLMAASDNERKYMDVSSTSQLRIFLEQRFLFYLEWLSLTQKTAAGLQIILRVSSMLGQFSVRDIGGQVASRATPPMNPGMMNPTDVDLVVQCLEDYTRFIQYHVALFSRFPLQIYVSALPLAPSQSMVWKNFQRLSPAWISKKPDSGQNWGSVVTSLDCHGLIDCLQFSPSQRWLAIGCLDGSVCLWDLGDGTLHQMTHNFLDRLHGFVFSSNSKFLAAISQSGRLAVWDVPDLSLVLRVEGSFLKHNYGSQMFSTCGTYLAHLGVNGEVRIWNTTTFVEVHCTCEPNIDSKILSYAWSDSLAAFVACGVQLDQICIWEVLTGQMKLVTPLTRRSHLSGRWVRWATFVPGAATLLLSVEEFEQYGPITARLVALDTRTKLLRSELGVSSAYSESYLGVSGNGLAFAMGERPVVYDLAQHEVVEIPSLAYNESDFVVCMDHSGKRSLFVQGAKAFVFDTTDDLCLFPVKSQEMVCASTMSTCGSNIALAYPNARVHILSLASLRLEIELESRDIIRWFAFAPNGAYLASLSDKNELTLYSRGKHHVRKIPHMKGDTSNPIAFSPTGEFFARRVFLGEGMYNTIALGIIWRSATNEVLRKVKLIYSVSNIPVAFTMDGKRIAYIQNKESVTLSNIQNGESEIALGPLIKMHNKILLQFSPFDKYLVCVSDLGQQIFDASNGTQLWQSNTSPSPSLDLATPRFSADEIFVATMRLDASSLWQAKASIHTFNTVDGACKSFTREDYRHLDVPEEPGFAFDESGSCIAYQLFWSTNIEVRYPEDAERQGLLLKAPQRYDTNTIMQVLGWHPAAQDHHLSLSDDQQWIRHNEVDIFGIPIEFRGSAVAIFGDTIAMTDRRGRLIIYTFDFSKIPEWSEAER